MNPATSLRNLDIASRNVSETENTTTTLANALLIHSPDSWSFQHFLDRITHVVAQAEHLTRGSNLTALTGRRGTARVEGLWRAIGFDEDHVWHAPERDMTIEKLFFSCKAVLVHPYLALKAMEQMDIAWTRPEFNVSLSDRKTVGRASIQHEICAETDRVFCSFQVLYMSRSNGQTKNGGRRVINEAEVLAAVRQTLLERNLNETLVEFDQEQYADVQALSEFMSHQVVAIVGPHGGAMMNHRFGAPDTLVIEFFPTNWMNFAHWEESSMLNQTYAAIVVEPTEGTDIEIDPENVAQLLRDNLGKVRQESIHNAYPWVME
jgi:hypothetical protein